ncbi:MAG: hypothetical protein ACR2IB_12260 [Pyrinomonadaceae bacterium]
MTTQPAPAARQKVARRKRRRRCSAWNALLKYPSPEGARAAAPSGLVDYIGHDPGAAR